MTPKTGKSPFSFGLGSSTGSTTASQQEALEIAAAVTGVTPAQEELIQGLDPRFFTSDFDSVTYALEVNILDS